MPRLPSFRDLSRLRRLAPRRLAFALSGVWAVVVIAYGIGFLSVAAQGQGRGTVFIDAMFFLLALTMPLVLIWLAVWLSEELVRQRALVTAIAEAIGPLAQALEQGPRGGTGSVSAGDGVTPHSIERAVQSAVSGLRAPDLGRPIDRLIIGQSRIEATLQRLVNAPKSFGGTERSAAPAETVAVGPQPEPVEAQAAPEVAPDPTPAGGMPQRPAWSDLVRALDFPRDADDAEGFRALKIALRYPALQQMLQAAEDVLNLLSQDGVYVDELPMDPVEPTAWRRFISGIRGPEVAAVGGIRDPQALEAARRLASDDLIFRNSALFFQRRFDGVLKDFASDASDAALMELAGTRSGRAFMLLARQNGALD